MFWFHEFHALCLNGVEEGTKTQSPGIVRVLCWRPPDLHIVDTDPSLQSEERIWTFEHDISAYQ